MIPGAFGRALLDFFLPPKCLLCGETPGSQLQDRPCPVCLSRIKFFSSPRCPRCGIGFVSPSERDHLCSGCLTEEPYFARARAVCLYEGLIVETICRFKYGGVTRLARPLGSFLTEYRDPEFPFTDFDLILPVPLHSQRLRERGFNQSLLLARRFSRKHSLPLNFTALQRSRSTRPQTELSGAERRTNVRGAFLIQEPEAVAGRRVLLVDDVFTTGATVRECARVLIRAGAQRVDVLTLARVA
jgi:ComF family protein